MKLTRDRRQARWFHLSAQKLRLTSAYIYSSGARLTSQGDCSSGRKSHLHLARIEEVLGSIPRSSILFVIFEPRKRVLAYPSKSISSFLVFTLCQVHLQRLQQSLHAADVPWRQFTNHWTSG